MRLSDARTRRGGLLVVRLSLPIHFTTLCLKAQILVCPQPWPSYNSSLKSCTNQIRCKRQTGDVKNKNKVAFRRAPNKAKTFFFRGLFLCLWMLRLLLLQPAASVRNKRCRLKWSRSKKKSDKTGKTSIDTLIIRCAGSSAAGTCCLSTFHSH